MHNSKEPMEHQKNSTKMKKLNIQTDLSSPSNANFLNQIDRKNKNKETKKKKTPRHVRIIERNTSKVSKNKQSKIEVS